jgi:hypothetical protein
VWRFEEMPRMGRPKVDDPKLNKVTIRFSEEEYSQLEAYADQHDLKKSQVLMKAFKEMIQRESKKSR